MYGKARPRDSIQELADVLGIGDEKEVMKYLQMAVHSMSEIDVKLMRIEARNHKLGRPYGGLSGLAADGGSYTRAVAAMRWGVCQDESERDELINRWKSIGLSC